MNSCNTLNAAKAKIITLNQLKHWFNCEPVQQFHDTKGNLHGIIQIEVQGNVQL